MDFGMQKKNTTVNHILYPTIIRIHNEWDPKTKRIKKFTSQLILLTLTRTILKLNVRKRIFVVVKSIFQTKYITSQGYITMKDIEMGNILSFSYT
jgi:hypothetical protein